MVVRHHTRAVLLSLRRLLCFCVLLLLSSLPTISQAQITLDGSLGPRGALQGPNYTISDKVGQSRGPNLFHSFGQFNLSKGESATFTGPNTITNILSRVTGGYPSSIDGTIRSQIPRANLYLLNPSGVMFGPNASLDVSGSFHVSTADYLRLSDGATFSAHPAGRTVLSVAPPAAFGFLGPTSAPISIQGSALQVPAGQTMSVIGGDIEIMGGALVAAGGRINLASVAAAGEVGMNPADPTAPLQVGSVATLGQMHLVDAQLDVSGIRGGTVVLRSGRLMLDNTSIAADTQGDVHGARVGIDIGVTANAVVTNGSLITADVGGAGNAGSIRIAADSLEVSQASIIRSQSAAGTTGDVGHIDMTARLMQVTDGSRVSGDTHGAGHGGDVTVRASEALTISGQDADGNVSAVSSDTFGGGAAGRVTVSAPRLVLDGGAFISSDSLEGSTGNAGTIVVDGGMITLRGGASISSNTFGPGHGGSVKVTASDTLTLAGTSPDGAVSSGLFAVADGPKEGAGAAGSIVVSAPRIMVTGGAQIVSRSLGPGHGGSITVTASDTLTLAGTGTDSEGTFPSGLFANARGTEAGAGAAGTIVVSAPRIMVTDGAEISSSTFGPGHGGDVTVRASEALTITGRDAAGFPSGVLSSTSGSGAAGRVTVMAPTLRMDDGVIQARATSESSGDAGSILITAGSITLTAGAQIDSSSAGTGQGGQVTVTATDPVLLTGQGTGLFTRTAGPGQGGDITVQAPRVTLLDDATISAESTGLGNAGNITLTLGDSFLSTHGSIVTRATQADGGDIRITAPNFLRLRDSAITAEVGGGATTVGGNISIDPQFVLLQNSQIVANAFAGQGGNIRIQAQQVFLADPTSQVSASSALGIDGQVAIQAPVTNVSGTVAPLPQTFARAGELLRDRCGERVRGAQ
jgi:filamentous hemagglutinin family protein